MRFLTFEIEGHRLAVPAERVASVGKPYSKERVRPVDVRRRLGGETVPEEGHPVITCRLKKKLVEFPVDRVLNLEDYLDSQLKPWPGTLKENRMFRGVVDFDGELFFLLDIEAILEEAGRTRR